jgi:hypothetical protein
MYNPTFTQSEITEMVNKFVSLSEKYLQRKVSLEEVNEYVQARTKYPKNNTSLLWNVFTKWNPVKALQFLSRYSLSSHRYLSLIDGVYIEEKDKEPLLSFLSYFQ